MKNPFATALAFIISCGFSFSGTLELHPLFSDHAVLQRSDATPVWGKAAPGSEIQVDFAGLVEKTTANEEGRWSVDLDLANVADGPFPLTVRGDGELQIQDVLVGEVWLASGQSNMQFALRGAIGGEKAITESLDQNLRVFDVSRIASPTPLDAVEGEWAVSAPATAAQFSAVAYFFARELRARLGVPVGIIHASWGGTQIESWTSPEALRMDPELKSAVDAQYEALTSYPEALTSYLDSFQNFLDLTERNDPGLKDAAAYLESARESSQWQPIEIPGVSDKPGAVWLRRSIKLDAETASRNLILVLGVFEGFETVFWNGKKIGQENFRSIPGAEHHRRFIIPPADLREGFNELAIRLFSPTNPPGLLSPVLKAGNLLITAEWQAHQEFELPELSREQLEQLPGAPPAPRAPQGIAGSLFQGMIQPLIPYGIRGVIWYQGEGNVNRAKQYATIFPRMIQDWRKRWGRGDFPFYFCQIANHRGKDKTPDESRLAEVRDAQTKALDLPSTGMAVTIDLGEAESVHPANKSDVGNRLARLALARTYGEQIPHSGPSLASSELEEGAIRLHFHPLEGGLVAAPVPETYETYHGNRPPKPLTRNIPESELEGFAICGEDRRWVWAQARIEGDSVVVWSPSIGKPIAVRHGWSDNPTINLYSADGLPAGPFRTDDFEGLSKTPYK